MRTREKPPVGMLAGGGHLPLEIAQAIRARGRDVHVVGLRGEVDADFSGFPLTSVRWGEIGKLVSSFRSAGCRELVIVGRVKRPDWRNIRPDLGLLLSLPRIIGLVRAGGDDGVLRNVVRFFESKGFTVVGPSEAAPAIVAPLGAIGRHAPDAQSRADAHTGLAVIAALGAFDIGQAAVVRRGKLIALEGAEGTDAMLRRIAPGIAGGPVDAPAKARSGVLVKRPKPGQELRVDMPAIGPDTIARAKEAGLLGIALAAGGVLIGERERVRASADDAGLFVAGVDVDIAGWGGPRSRPAVDEPLRALGRGQPGEPDSADAERALGALRALSPYCASRGIVIVRRHVLGVETGEGEAALVERTAGLRQWGDRGQHRRGVLVLGASAGLSDEIVAATGRMGLAGIVVRRDVDPTTDSPEARAIARADEIGMFIAAAGGSAEHDK